MLGMTSPGRAAIVTSCNDETRYVCSGLLGMLGYARWKMQVGRHVQHVDAKWNGAFDIFAFFLEFEGLIAYGSWSGLGHPAFRLRKMAWHQRPKHPTRQAL